jgi:ribosomal protein S18 acetylase RimI-like enzyme
MNSPCNKNTSSIRIQRWWDGSTDKVDEDPNKIESRKQVLYQMLQIAAHEGNFQTVVENPNLSCYVEMAGHRSNSDLVAVVAQNTHGSGDCHGSAVVGAAWMQTWKNPNGVCGFGFMDHNIPEIAMGVLPDYQGQGIGTLLLKDLIQIGLERNFSAICLSVREDNLAAVRLYERMGFRRVNGSEEINRLGTFSYKMVRTLCST